MIRIQQIYQKICNQDSVFRRMFAGYAVNFMYHHKFMNFGVNSYFSYFILVKD